MTSDRNAVGRSQLDGRKETVRHGFFQLDNENRALLFIVCLFVCVTGDKSEGGGST